MVHSYRYLHRSSVGDGVLSLQTSGGTALRLPNANPLFYSGFVASPAVAASGLRAVAKVAATRYFSPISMRSGDPVVTCNGDRLRFESLSGCCGVYARLDVLPGALDGDVRDLGTTNVDIGEPTRRMLARVTDSDPMHLVVGPDELVLSTPACSVVERKVDLPQRWLRGFAELPVLTAGFEPRFELRPAEARRFLRSLSSVPRSRGCSWVVPSGPTVRLSSRPVPGAVCLAGPQRLDSLLPLLPDATGVRVYGPAVTAASLPCASAWEVNLPCMRFTVVLSPELGRGFSGEGATLDHLVGERVAEDAESIGAVLAFQPRVELDLLHARTGIPFDRVRSAVIALGVSGRLGYDLAEAAYFHRELPYDGDLVERFSPRLRDARALVAAGAVALRGDFAVVNGHRVGFTAAGVTCTCRWWAEFRGTRGKCAHVLAAVLLKEPE